MKIHTIVLIALLMISPAVLASIESTFLFEGDGILYSGTETLNDGSRLEASAVGPVKLNQSLTMAGTQRQSQMQLDSNYGTAAIKSPEYNLRMKGYNLSSTASSFRISENTASSPFPALTDATGSSIDNEIKATQNSIATIATTKLQASVFVSAKGKKGTVNRRITLPNDGKGNINVGVTTFSGQFDFTDHLALSGLVIKKEWWQGEIITPIGSGEEL